jgi:hypothetical protein
VRLCVSSNMKGGHVRQHVVVTNLLSFRKNGEMATNNDMTNVRDVQTVFRRETVHVVAYMGGIT